MSGPIVDLSRTTPDRDEGVYYRRQDYAGLGRRLLASTVDGVVVAVGLIGLILVADASASGVLWGFLTWLALAFLYLVTCKRTRLRTLGYRLCRIRLVGIHGDSPSSWRVTFRLMLALMGVYSSALGLIDFLWLTGDDNRQTLRDKLAQTYVIRTSAEPAGRGPTGYDVYHVLAWTLVLREVRRIA